MVDARTELLIDGAYTNISTDVYLRDRILIERGRADEADRVDAGRCGLTLNNRGGKYSPRNPTGTHFGKIGRNTGIRVSVHEGSTYLHTAAQSKTIAAHGAATTPDAAALDITGDIDIRVDARIYAWSANVYTLASKYIDTGDQRSWQFRINSDGKLGFSWSTDGTFANTTHRTSTVPAAWWSHTWFRVTLDVDNGATQHVVTFYTSEDGVTWTQLGDAVTGTGVTSIFASTAELRAGGRAPITNQEGFRGEFRHLELRNGIAGTVVADPDFTAQTAGAASFNDGTGKTWTVNTGKNAELTKRRTRFCGEVANWPPRWDLTGNDVYTPIEAAGIIRRLSQGDSPLHSALRRELTAPSRPDPVAYWPCEDGEDATHFGSAAGGAPLRINVGKATLATYDGFACSGALPTMGDAQLLGQVGPYSDTGKTILRCLVHVPSAATANKQLVAFRTTGTANLWIVWYDGAGGDLTLKAYDADGTQILTSGSVNFNIDGENIELRVELTKNGLTIDWAIGVRKIFSDGTSTASETTGNLNDPGFFDDTVGRVIRISANWDRALTDVAIGHIVLSNSTDLFTGIQRALEAHHGEAAGRRAERLSTEEKIPFRGVGDMNATEPMGPQLPKTLLTLLTESADTDNGILHETRDECGVTLRAGHSLHSQTARLTLDYDLKQVSPPFEPVEDDQHLRNDVTVQREGGASARASLDTGALSTLAPPDGVGRYDEQITLSLDDDDQAKDQAGWRLRLGTFDAARYPSVTVNLARHTTLVDNATAVVEGDRVVVTNPPAWLPPDDIELLAQGFSEDIHSKNWTLTCLCAPAGPWRVAVLGDKVLGRLDTDGSELNAAVTSTATSLSVRRVGDTVEDFEDNVFAIVVAPDGDAGWARSNAQAKTGLWSFKSGAITHNQTTDAIVAVPTGAKTLTFWRLISSESGFDFGEVYLDGVRQLRVSGLGTWTEETFDVSSISLVTFRYVKDGNINNNDDAFYIDDLTFAVDDTTPLWTTDAAEFPLDIGVGGERITVTAITGATSPQTFTVTRSVNGVVKAHSAGTDVRLWTPMILGL